MRAPVMMTDPVMAVKRKPNRSATMPARNPARYVVADPTEPTKAMDDGLELGKMTR